MQDLLQFLQDLPIYKHEQPYDLYGYPEQQSETQTNCEFENKAVTVIDAREGIPPTIETHGFMYFQHQSSCELDAKHFETVGGENKVVVEYLAETIDLVQRMLNAVDVICFDWRVRSQYFFGGFLGSYSSILRLTMRSFAAAIRRSTAKYHRAG